MNSLTILCIIYGISLVLFGGFHEFSRVLIGLLLCAFLLLKKNNTPINSQSPNSGQLYIAFFPLLILCAAFSRHLTSMSLLLALLQLSIPFLFLLCVLREDICSGQNTVPASSITIKDLSSVRLKFFLLTENLGVFMTILGCITFFVDKWKPLFFQADRFGGFFQYSGTCALFLIVCAMINLSEEVTGNISKIIFRNARLLLLLIGILMTGSRGPLLLFLPYAVFFHNRNKAHLFKKLIALSVFTCLATFLTLSKQNFGRIFTLFSNSSTIWGRILYHLDGYRCLIKNPFGLGHLGYYYLQGTFQTGPYTTRYVHDDILQCGLDYGILPMALVIVFFAYQLIKGTQSRLQKELLAMILLCSLIDFDLQYTMIVFLLILCLDLTLPLPGFLAKIIGPGQRKARSTPFSFIKGLKNWTGERVLCLLAALAFFYLLLPFSAHFIAPYCGDPSSAERLSHSMLPMDTDFAEAILEYSEDPGEAEELCNIILKHNPYSRPALHSMVYLSKMRGDEEAMANYMVQNYSLQPYDMDLYESYIALASENEDAKNRLSLLLDETKARTGSIAYKLRDVPFQTQDGNVP